PPEEKRELIQNFIKEEEEEEEDDEIQNVTHESLNESNVTEESIDVKKKYESEFDNWFNSPDFDKTYGPKKIHSQIVLGTSVVKFTGEKVIVVGSKKIEFRLTPGLLQLIFLKSPISYTRQDLDSYKSILLQTNAHLTADGSKKSNLVYWNSPNELVDRLRLLCASKTARNTRTNEIISILEELLEAGLIKHCFTKYVSAIPLKSKTRKEVTKAMSDILTFRSPNTTKACVVERFNRTLKGNMFRAFTANGSREWVSILSQLIEKYNSSKHRTTGMTPIQADQNPSSVMLNQRSIPVRKKKFIVGDKVRVSVNKGVFTKGYLPNWSTEVFTVVKINDTLPFTYRLEDYKGNPIIGCFYTEEINKTSFPHD
ncbi:Ribonuclease H-like domain, partial [Cinara cedri]